MNIEQMNENEDLYEEILNLRRLLTLAQRHVEEGKYGYALATLDLAVDACGRLAGGNAHQTEHPRRNRNLVQAIDTYRTVVLKSQPA